MAIDEDDLHLVAGLTIYQGVNGYAYYSKWERGRSIPRTVHALLMGFPSEGHVDHINGNKLDNTRSNLRVVTPQQNQVNRKQLNKNNSSGVRGVSYSPNLSASKPWRAQIMADGRQMHLGCFATLDEAKECRRLAEIKYFGEVCP